MQCVDTAVQILVTTMSRTYSELSRLDTFEERYNYLKLLGDVGRSTFGYDRWINQRFYRSREWKHVRDVVIVRDDGCDMGLEEYPIFGKVLIHHMNPISVESIKHEVDNILDPEFLISVTLDTHNAIHYGIDYEPPNTIVERRPGDTRLW